MATLTNASSVVLVNRPSENTKPTESDRKVTKQVAVALEAVDVPLFDHVTSSRDDSYSVRNNDESEVLRFLWEIPILRTTRRPQRNSRVSEFRNPSRDRVVHRQYQHLCINLSKTQI